MKYISWDTESQPATSEEEEKEGNKGEVQNQIRKFINTITNVFDYYEEKGGNNWIFCTLSRTAFGSFKYLAEMRAQLVVFMSARSERFSGGQNDFKDYLILLIDYQTWSGQQELQAFADLYVVNISFYDRITSSNPMYYISSGISTNQTNSLFFNGNH